MSEHTESLKVWLCPRCSKQLPRRAEAEVDGNWIVGHFHDDGHFAGFVPAEEVEVIPAEQLAKVEAERDKLETLGYRIAEERDTAKKQRDDLYIEREECWKTIDRLTAQRRDFEGFKERLTSPEALRAVAAAYYEEPTGTPLALTHRLVTAAISAAEQEQPHGS